MHPWHSGSLDRRPVLDPEGKARLWEILDTCLRDCRQACAHLRIGRAHRQCGLQYVRLPSGVTALEVEIDVVV